MITFEQKDHRNFIMRCNGKEIFPEGGKVLIKDDVVMSDLAHTFVIKDDDSVCRVKDGFKIGETVRLRYPLTLTNSTIANKFSILGMFFENLYNKYGDEFDEWFVKFVLDFYTAAPENKFKVVENNIPTLKEYVNKYIDDSGIDFDQFVNESKVKKTSILFTADEIKQLIKVSGYLKVYTIFANSEQLHLNKKGNKRAYNILASDIMESEIVTKIFNVIKTKTFRYNITDRYMWEYIRNVQCKSIDVHVIEIFNFIMNSIMVLCEEGRNPITYFVSVVDESIKWFLRSVYKDSIIYDDSITTEDIHSPTMNNLKTYSFNDTLGVLKGIAFDKIYKSLEKVENTSFKMESDDLQDTLITQFQNRVSKIEYVSPIHECLAYPILSRLTKIPYDHFFTLSPDHTAVLSVYLNSLMRKVFKSDYSDLIALLMYFPQARPAVATTYTIKSYQRFLAAQNSTKDFFGFNTKTLPHQIISFFIGRISRINFVHTVTGKDLVGIPLSKVETDMIDFYTKYFGNQMENEIAQMKRLMEYDF